MASLYEGDIFCQSVMSHRNKCVSSGTAGLALSTYIHQINATWQKKPNRDAGSSVGPGAVRRGGVRKTEAAPSDAEELQAKAWRSFQLFTLTDSGHPQIPTLIMRKQLKVSSFNVYLN